MSESEVTSVERDYFLSSTAYDKLKPVVQLGLPAAGTLYFTLSTIWNLPYGEQVVGTIAAITTFLGVILQYSSKTYNKSVYKYNGAINVSESDEGVKVFSLELNEDPHDLDTKQEVLFKINPDVEGRS